MKTVIFSGTTEGRQLSEMLCDAGREHYVCVATKYGSEVMTENDLAKVHVGRMDSAGMSEYLKSNGMGAGDTVVDATHPYATDVSDNIRKAVKECGCHLIRVDRIGKDGGSSNPKTLDNINKYYVNKYGSVEEFAHVADGLDGNILLTTGSKELAKYCGAVSPDTLSRTYVRVIPSEESLEICCRCNLASSNIIAMQGPFSYEMNRALLKDLHVRHLFTKESGQAGGFEEKVRAASDLSVSVHILRRPGSDDDGAGIPLSEAFEKITGSPYHPKRHIYLVGLGPGSKDLMTLEAVEAIRSSDAVFGAQRMLDAVERSGLIGDCETHPMYRAEEITVYLKKKVYITKICVLFSGDSGFYSGAKEAFAVFRKWDENAETVILPGVSSVSYMASRCAEPYDDAAIMSVHGRNSLHNLMTLLEMIRDNRKTFALMSDDSDVRTICEMLKKDGITVTVKIGRNLSYGSGKSEIITTDPERGAEYHGEGSITVLFINDSR
ncbi:MAG: precorrin-6A reductase [Lachnospiraceae bacterium]|nr:precorrin-6A reductase [Lachnospiraceae bacterium]